MRALVLFGVVVGALVALLWARPAMLLGGEPPRLTYLVTAHQRGIVGYRDPVGVISPDASRIAYTEGTLKAGLAKYHDEPDSAFYGWNDVWLSPAFRRWNIEAQIAGISAPLLAVQGVDDEYGTLAQIRNIKPQVPQAQLLEIPACRHSPHRDQPQLLIAAVLAFVQDHRPS